MTSKHLPLALIFFSILIALSTGSYSQDREFGVFLGGSYYNGELNPGKHVIDLEIGELRQGIYFIKATFISNENHEQIIEKFVKL